MTGPLPSVVSEPCSTFSDHIGKRLVLMVENLNMMLGDMMDRDAGWRLRKTLQTEPRIILLGSAISRFAEIDRPDLSLYDLFPRDHPASPRHDRMRSALEVHLW